MILDIKKHPERTIGTLLLLQRKISENGVRKVTG